MINRALSALLGLLGLFATLALSLGLAQALPNNRTLDEIQDRGVIDVAVYRDFPPFSYREDGVLKGVDVDLAAKLAEGLGVTLDLVELTADESVDDDLRNAIWKGHYLGGTIVDIMMHVPYDRDLNLRNDMVVLTAPYYREDIVLASDPAKVGENATIAPFRFNPISVELDSLADLYLTGTMGGAIRGNVVHFPTLEQAAAALVAGETAGVLGPRSQVEAGIAAHGDGLEVGQPPLPGLTRNTWLVGVAVSGKARQLGYLVADLLGGMVKDGTVEAIFRAHGLTHVPPPAGLLP